MVATHEIIASYERPLGQDLSYAYLMCAVLFVGQASNCKASTVPILVGLIISQAFCQLTPGKLPAYTR